MQFTKALVGFLLLPGLLVATQSLAEDIEWELSNSNVGVGTGAPSSKLHVVGVGGGSVEEVFRLESTAAPQQVFLNSGTGAKWFFAMTGDDSFKVSYDGTGRVEARFRQNGNLIIAGALTQNSDRNSKNNISEIDSAEVLERVIALPISSWEYKADSGVKHLGPMAQDFYAAFGLGRSPTGISTIDTGGVALAAIQGMHAQLEDKASQLKQVVADNEALRAELQQYDERMLQLEAALTEVLRNQSSIAQVGSAK